MNDYLENSEGVHFMNPILGEFTLCGDSFDFQITENLPSHMELKPTRKRTVTCPKCSQVILGCRRVTVKQDRMAL